MRQTKFIFGLLAASPFLFAATCSRPAGNSCEGVMCTADFRMITVEIRDKAGNPAKLDSSVTIGAAGNVIATTPGSIAGNSYTVADDGYQKNVRFRQERVSFKGFQNGKEVVNEPFTVTADCCHISKVSGPTTITIP